MLTGSCVLRHRLSYHKRRTLDVETHDIRDLNHDGRFNLEFLGLEPSVNSTISTVSDRLKDGHFANLCLPIPDGMLLTIKLESRTF